MAAAGHFLYVDLEIEARQAWAGLLSFEVSHDYRSYARCPVEIL